MKHSKFRVVSYFVTILFAILILYPLIYIGANAMKDSAKIYDTPPKLTPDTARSLSIVVDYSGMEEAGLLESIQKDHITAMLSTIYELPKESLFEVKFYGTMNGKTVYYARAHRGRIDLEKDQGVFQGVAITAQTLDYPERIQRAIDSMGYKFDLNGLNQTVDAAQLGQNELNETVGNFLQDTYGLNGNFKGTTLSVNNWLLLESFAYYFRLPSFLYANNKAVSNFSFFVFLFNTIIVIVWAMVMQALLCALTAFPLSRLLPRKTANRMLLFFLGTTMIPFVSVMIPQFTMFKSMGFYDNYAALLLPHLLPYGFYVYLYKGFFDQIPGSYFEAAELDGAGSFYLYTRICMPLSKPIISLIALQTFIGNWNDFFWAWLVTEDQKLWTLNVALYNISNNVATKQNALMGLAVVTITPVILLSILFSKQLKQSIVASGVKG